MYTIYIVYIGDDKMRLKGWYVITLLREQQQLVDHMISLRHIDDVRLADKAWRDEAIDRAYPMQYKIQIVSHGSYDYSFKRLELCLSVPQDPTDLYATERLVKYYLWITARYRRQNKWLKNFADYCKIQGQASKTVALAKIAQQQYQNILANDHN